MREGPRMTGRVRLEDTQSGRRSARLRVRKRANFAKRGGKIKWRRAGE